jgi:hypothetical protein
MRDWLESEDDRMAPRITTNHGLPRVEKAVVRERRVNTHPL